MNHSNALAMAAIGLSGAAVVGFAINIYTKTKNSCTVDSYRDSLRAILIIGTIAVTISISYFICHFSCGSFAYPEEDDYQAIGLVEWFRGDNANLYFWILSAIGAAIGISLWVFCNKFIDGMKAKGCPNTAQVETSINFIRMTGVIMTFMSLTYFVGKFGAVILSAAEKSASRAEDAHLTRIEKTAKYAEERAEKAERRRDRIKRRDQLIRQANKDKLRAARYKREEAERKKNLTTPYGKLTEAQALAEEKRIEEMEEREKRQEARDLKEAMADAAEAAKAAGGGGGGGGPPTGFQSL